MSPPGFIRLQAFLDSKNLAAGQGGKRTGGWRRHLATLFLSIGFMLAGVLPATPPHKPGRKLTSREYKSHIAACRAEMDACDNIAPVVVLDRSPAACTLPAIRAQIEACLHKQGKSLTDFGFLKDIPRNLDDPTGHSDNICLPGTDRPVLRIVYPMHPDTTAMEKLAGYAHLPAGVSLRKDLPISTAHSAVFTFGHEGLGHATERREFQKKYAQDPMYYSHLREIRSDIAATIRLTNLDGNTARTRLFSWSRDLGMYYLFSYFRNTNWIRSTPSSACLKNLGPTSRRVCDKLDRILANPKTAAAFRDMTPNELVKLENQLFEEVMPSKEDFRANAAVIRDAVLQENDPEIRRKVENDVDLSRKTGLFLARVAQARAWLVEPAPFPQAK